MTYTETDYREDCEAARHARWLAFHPEEYIRNGDPADSEIDESEWFCDSCQDFHVDSVPTGIADTGHSYCPDTEPLTKDETVDHDRMRRYAVRHPSFSALERRSSAHRGKRDIHAPRGSYNRWWLP